jgi:uncharacterized protein (TIGR03435 family)
MTPKAQRTLARITLLVLVSMPALAQSTDAASSTAQTKADPAATDFELADVHPTPPTTTPWMTGGNLHGNRYLLHNATMVDMISLAYGIDDEDDILGGPAWIDFDRFDISARIPHGASPNDVKLMLRALLANRFKLVVHNDSHPRLSYVLHLDKGTPKLKQSTPTEPSGIEEHDTPTDAAPDVPVLHTIILHNRTMAQFADLLQHSAAAYLPRPVVDATGLKGGWDFSLAWTGNPAAGGISIFEAISHQLDLSLILEKSPAPVLTVDSVDRQPTPNAPDIDKMLPPPPPPEFDVAVLKPSKPGTQFSARITGNQITASGVTLKFFVAFAYGINDRSTDLIVNAPNFFDQDRWDLLAKAAPEALAIGRDGQPKFDFDLLPRMVQTMLNDRFHMKSHLEDRTIDALTLVADHPKMKKADPLNRSSCKEGPGADGKDPRIANPILARLLSCQNMTMNEFAAELPTYAEGYVFTPVLDGTGLTDAYDFTLSFSRMGDLHSSLPPPASAGNDPAEAETQSDPNGGLTLKEAMARQLGIKLEKRKRPVPVLVIDHIEEQPTEN